jgi:hypothetical protein
MGIEDAVGRLREQVTIHIPAGMEFNPILAVPARSLVRENSG